MRHNSHFDTVIVGGGPAGSAAALTLARAGLRVGLLDKAAFPRNKLCGGLISERSLATMTKVFGLNCHPPFEASSRNIKVFFEDRLLNEVADYRRTSFVSRAAFDAFLLARAEASGVTVLQSTAAMSLTGDRTAVIAANGEHLEAPFIIGADGANSRTRKALQSAHVDRGGFAVGLEMEVPRSFVKREVYDPEIYLGVVRWGYAWVFPKRETLTVGVGGLAVKNPDMRVAFAKFAETAIGGIPERPLLGHPIPFGNYLEHPGQGSVLLVGDAAGLVEPITGEGIAFAMESGHQAALAILEARREGAPHTALARYEQRYQRIVSVLRDARLLRYLIFSKRAEPWFARVLSLQPSIIRKHLDVLAGEADYRDYGKHLSAAVLRALPTLLFKPTRTWRPLRRSTPAES